MSFFRALRAGLILAGLAGASKPFPPPPASYVHNEGVVSPSAEHVLSERLRRFEAATGHQFVVALFQSLDGESLEEYTNKLFRAWKIGDAKRNDGLLFCVFLKDRRWRVEVGYGLESTLTDLESARIARDYGTPAFRSGDFDGGVRAVVEALAAKAQGLPAPPGPAPGPSGDETGIILALFFLFLSGFVFLIWALTRSFRPSSIRGGRRTSGGGSWSSGGGDWGGGGGFSDGGGFSGGGGSSGGGGASGGW